MGGGAPEMTCGLKKKLKLTLRYKTLGRKLKKKKHTTKSRLHRSRGTWHLRASLWCHHVPAMRPHPPADSPLFTLILASARWVSCDSSLSWVSFPLPQTSSPKLKCSREKKNICVCVCVNDWITQRWRCVRGSGLFLILHCLISSRCVF